jgi:dTDP-4-dehydrorhamnose reductase
LTDVLVLGASGMLGGMVARVLDGEPQLNVTRAARASAGEATIPFDAEQEGSVERLLASARWDWLVNAVGVIKPLIDETDPACVARATAVNETFPQRLAAGAERAGSRVIQIATDGVFSGRSAPYDEETRHDADGVYERSKSGGEVSAPHVLNLRCSIIGPEGWREPRSLLGWALSQPSGARISGYTNHRWNGVTSLHFARLCRGVILAGGLDLPWLLHVVPADTVSKAELLELALQAFGRTDVTASAEPGPIPVDRTLTTRYPEANRRLWAAAGYAEPPRIATMIAELASLQA